MRIRLAAFALCLILSQLAMGQATPTEITNSDVISMTKAGIGEQTIILAIQRGADKFDTSPQALIALKGAGVSDLVLNAMLASDNSRGATSSVQTPAQPQELSGNCSPAGSDDATRAASYSCECNRGNMDACTNLGLYYRMGWGVSKNSSQASRLFKKACDGGSGSGCQLQEAAAASATGSNTTQSEESSRSGNPADSIDAARVTSYRRLCDSGGMDACANLGFYYRMGWGVPEDPSQATTLIKKACDAGSAIGCSLQKEYSSSASPSGQNGIPAANKSQGQPVSAQSGSSGTSAVICQNDEALSHGWSSNCAHLWFSGALVKVMRSNGVLVAVAMQDTGKYFIAQVSVVNKTASPLDVRPQSFSSMVLRPHPKTLRYLPPDKVIQSVSNSVAWSNFFTALGAASATQQSVTQSTTNGTASAYGTGGSAYGRYSENTTSVTSAPDQQAQQDAANRIAANNAAVAALAQKVSAGSFQPTTVAPGKSVTGNVYFERARKIESSQILIPVNGEVFDFNFQWE